MIICLTLLCGYAKVQTRCGDSSPPLPKEISAELFDKAVALIKEFEGWHAGSDDGLRFICDCPHNRNRRIPGIQGFRYVFNLRPFPLGVLRLRRVVSG